MKQQTCLHGVLLILCLASCTSVLNAQQQAIRIRFANGKTGKPLKLKVYEYGDIGSRQKGYRIVKIDRDSLLVTFNDVSAFSFRSSIYDPCDTATKNEQAPKYDISEIREHGSVSPNYCGNHHAVPIPGELLVYSRHQHWWAITKQIAQGLLICG